MAFGSLVPEAEAVNPPRYLEVSPCCTCVDCLFLVSFDSPFEWVEERKWLHAHRNRMYVCVMIQSTCRNSFHFSNAYCDCPCFESLPVSKSQIWFTPGKRLACWSASAERHSLGAQWHIFQCCGPEVIYELHLCDCFSLNELQKTQIDNTSAVGGFDLG